MAINLDEKNLKDGLLAWLWLCEIIQELLSTSHQKDRGGSLNDAEIERLESRFANSDGPEKNQSR